MFIEKSLWRVSLWEKESGWECSVQIIATTKRMARRMGVEVMFKRGDILCLTGKKAIRKTNVQVMGTGVEVEL